MRRIKRDVASDDRYNRAVTFGVMPRPLCIRLNQEGKNLSHLKVAIIAALLVLTISRPAIAAPKVTDTTSHQFCRRE